MEFPQDIEALGRASQTFLMMHGSALPAPIRDKLIDLLGSPSPVDRIVKTGEFLYAKRDELPAAASELAAGLIAFATGNGWHGLALEGRGTAIVRALQRNAGEKPPAGLKVWPAADTDPAPLAEFLAGDAEAEETKL